MYIDFMYIALHCRESRRRSTVASCPTIVGKYEGVLMSELGILIGLRLCFLFPAVLRVLRHAFQAFQGVLDKHENSFQYTTKYPKRPSLHSEMPQAPFHLFRAIRSGCLLGRGSRASRSSRRAGGARRRPLACAHCAACSRPPGSRK